MDYYKLNKEKIISLLKSNTNGLIDSEVKIRQEKFGKNTISIGHKVSFIQLLLYQFKNYLAWLLIFLTVFAFFTGFYFNKKEQVIGGIIISIIILVNVFVGAYQEYKSEKTAQLLKSMLKNEAMVLRNNKKQKINAEELVPGDIILLEEGDKVPADLRIIESKEFRVDESMLTGESRAVLKNSSIISKTVPLANRKNLIFMNSYIVGGTAVCIVIRTGKETEVGKIAKSLDMKQSSPFIKEVDQASKKITYVALALIIIVSLLFFVRGNNWISVFMIASALVIGSIPEGLPAIVTFTLALGSLKLAKNNVLVKKKSLLETLGSVDVICTDKTGTLTENRMTIKKLFFDMGVSTSVDKISKKTFSHFSHCALLANEAKDTDKGFQGGSEDTSLIDFFKNEGISILELRKNYPAQDFEPFSSEKKYSSSTNKVDDEIIKYMKGAPEIILNKCDYLLSKGIVKKFSESEKEKILKILKDFSDESLRSIAFSYSVIKNKNLENKNIFIGFIGMYDSPKKDVKKTIEIIYQAGIEIKMITGDNIHTATAIAKECGFKNINATTWDEIKDLSVDELKLKVKENNVFARMSPEFKLKIVSALQENGNRVAITGDGVNDVPALKKAEVGIVMGNKGTDIAKEAADLILLDDNLSSIVDGIKEGRTIFSNIRKVINYLLTANIAEVFVVFLGSMFGVMPFLAIQLLWVNFVTDIAPAMALGSDAPHKNIMKKKPTGKNEKLINKKIILLTVFIGLKKVIIIFSLFYIIYKITGNLILAQTMSFTWLVMSHFVRIAAIRFDEGVKILSNKYVNWAMAIPVLFQLIILYTPLSKFFQVVPLTLFEWIIIIISFIIAVGLAKIITYLIDKSIPEKELDY